MKGRPSDGAAINSFIETTIGDIADSVGRSMPTAAEAAKLDAAIAANLKELGYGG